MTIKKPSATKSTPARSPPVGAPGTPPSGTRHASKAEVYLATGSNAPSPEEPRSLERALGLQVRTMRRERELSVAELATAAGISSGMMSKIENGQISPSLTTVQALANALNMPFTSLFSAFEEKRDCSHVAAGHGLAIERRGSRVGHVYELLGATIHGEVMVEPYLITLRDDAEPYTGFRHAGIEFIYMLSGAVVYRHADRNYMLEPGDSLLFDSGALHGPHTLAAMPMRFLSIIVYRRQMKD